MSSPPSIPQIDRLASSPELAGFAPAIAAKAARLAVAGLRARALAGEEIPFEQFVSDAVEQAKGLTSLKTKPAINLTGVVLHTGLGRARLADAAAEAAAAVAASHAVVEFDLESGQRGNRQSHVEDLLCELTGAAAALVVNNCASAVLLALSAVARGREVVLSRGQMVEIGGSFRMPDVIEASGCRLVEVGCTNKTRLSDFEDATNSDTGAWLKCHPSSYQIVGFTAQPDSEALASAAHDRGLMLIDDLGSGCLVDTTRFGLAKERTLNEALKAGADLVLASGDKLLGGPQAGLILGSKEAVAQLAKHPIARAVRIDKLTLAGLEATLRLYLEQRELEIPVWGALSRTVDDLRPLAEKLANSWPGDSAVVESESKIGGGSLPGLSVPTLCASLKSSSADRLARTLRVRPKPIVARIEGDSVLLDPRTATEDEIGEVCQFLSELEL